MYPSCLFCGKVMRPGRESIAPVSSLGLLTFNTKPLASPSVPGQASLPAALYQVPSQALAAKSYAVPAAGVAVGPPDVFVGAGVADGPPGVTVGPATLISTHQGLLPCVPSPNKSPLAFLNIQYPR